MKRNTISSVFVIFTFLHTIHICSPWRLKRPNIILLITDDQDIELGSMNFMPKTNHYLRDRGVTFLSGFVSTPICCPSRTSILTGLYVHNHHVLTNNQNCSGTYWRRVLEKKAFAPYVQANGYETAYFGKYLNEYDGSYIPPGWNEWMGLVKNSRFYNYTVNYNGERIKHGFDYERDYFTDLIANDTILFIQRHRRKHPLKPFLAVLSFPAPHGPEDPAPQYSHLFPNVETHRTESWNYAPNPDKQWLLQHTGRMEPIHVVFTDVLQRRRLQTLQSVDHSIQRLMNELRELGELSNTYIIYTSDHGYHLGQYGLVKGKNMPYEFDIRVPYFIRGPGIPRNLTIRNPVLNIDIAPTILDMAGVDQPDFMDGRSLLPLIHEQGRTQGKHQRAVRRSKTPVEWRDTVLIERGKMAKLTRIRERWQKQRDQYGKSARLQHACAQPEFQKLCVEDQQWKCVRDHVGKWRIFKCQEDLQIDEECECRPERHEKRQKYHPLLPRRKRAVVSLRRIATTAELDEEGKNVTVDEELLRRWEKEFIFFLQQKEIIESGQWFQGVFDGQNRSSTNYRIRRSQRVTRKEKPKSVSIGSLCTRFNSSISCDAVVFESAHLWTVHKNKLDDRIENLRKRLSAYKDIRRQLKKSRPGGDFERTNVANDGSSKECNCWPPRAHSLQNNASFQKYRNKESNHGRRREHRRKPYEISPRRWLREGTRTNCNVPQMNCFVHGADHWRTPPLWPAVYGEFCFCQNSNNNTYWCLRTVNATHNFLYCEFITEFISFYDLSSDPNQLQNSVWSLSVGVLEQLSDQLQLLRTCRGREQCEHYSHRLWNTPFEQVHRLSNS